MAIPAAGRPAAERQAPSRPRWASRSSTASRWSCPTTPPTRDATWGRGVSRTSVGYKLHAIVSGNPMPDAFAITTLNVCEKQMAARHDQARRGLRLPAGRRPLRRQLAVRLLSSSRPPTGLPPGQAGHRARGTTTSRRTAAGRSRCWRSRRRSTASGTTCTTRAPDIERDFSQMVCFGAGLGAAADRGCGASGGSAHWVINKLLINAARIRINRRKAA